MRKEQSWFLTRVVIGLLVTLCVAQMLSFALHVWVRASIAESEHKASESLRESAAQLTASDGFSSFNVIAVTLRSTQRHLSEHRQDTERIRSSLRLVDTAVLFRGSPVVYPSGTTAALVTAADTFSWLSSAAPAIARIAGYDARQDVAAAYDARDLYRRLYAAHIGMSALVPLLNNPPVTVGMADVADTSNSIHEALDNAAESIRALDAGGSADVSLARYVSSATKAAAQAAALQERFASEPFKASLLKLLQ